MLNNKKSIQVRNRNVWPTGCYINVGIVCVLFTLFSATKGVSQDLTLVNQYEKELYNTSDILVSSDSIIIVQDLSYDFGIYSLAFKRGIIIGGLEIGQGPNSISSRNKDMALYNNHILIWDTGNQRATLYDEKFNKTEFFPFDVRGYTYSLAPISNNKVVAITNEDSFLKILKRNDSNKEWELTKEYNSTADVLKDYYSRPLVRGTIKHTVVDGMYIFAHEYSSRLTAVNEEGIIFSTTQPYNYELEADEKWSENALPDLTDSELCVLDIDSYKEKYIFVLFKGEKISKDRIANKFVNPDLLIEEMLHTNKILVYNLKGDFVKEIQLNEQIKGFSIYQNKLFSYSTLTDKTLLYEYEIK
ncbi:MAG: hypothetical protein WC967_01260 [Balneolaceae bacterium]